MDKSEFEKSFNKFHFKVLKQILSRSNSSKNVIWSPFTLHLALTKLYLCSDDKTSFELAALLHYDVNLSKRDPARNVRNLLKALSDDPYPCFSEKLLIDQSFSLNDDINPRLEKYFGHGAGIHKVQFVKQEKTRRKINALVETDTFHAVQSVVQDDFAAASSAVMLQVMFVKANWEKGFNKEDVVMHPFYINDKEMSNVEMMFARNEFKYAKMKEWKCAALEMFFHKSELSFIILLPDSKTGLSNVESKICGKAHEKVFQKLDESFVSKGVNVAIPKLILEMDLLDMDSNLKKCNLSSLFDAKKCDLSDAVSDPFCISKIIHKTIIKFQTHGPSVPANPMLFDSKTPNFMVDHPFMFFVRLKNSSVCLVSGSIRKIESPPLPPANPMMGPPQLGAPPMMPPMMGGGPYVSMMPPPNAFMGMPPM